MKIVQITNFPPSLIGGLEAVVYHLSKELGKSGHTVKVITSTTDMKEKVIFYDEFSVLYIPSFDFKHRLVIPKNLGTICYFLQDAEIIHLHAPDVSFAFEIGLLSKVKRKPIVTSIFSYFDRLKHPFCPMKLLAMPIEGSVGILAKMSDAIHVKNISDYAKLSRVCNCVTYIPDGVPDTFFRKPKDPYLFNTKFGIKEKKIILYVGRLHHLKGPQVLVRSFKYVVKKEPEVLLIVVGAGDYRIYLEKLSRKLNLEKYILFTGILSEEEKISAYDAAKVVVIPSCSDFVEAFSLVASEAWARGKTVVASNVGALRYRVKAGINGYLVEPDNPIDLAGKILQALDMKIKAVPNDVCSWKDIAEKFEQLYRTVITSRYKHKTLCW
jgi:glycosyltransferase involved in cell wall biosynthesis